jgi:putative oxidoreductase
MSDRLRDLGLLVARLGFGLGFAWFHGYPKLRGGPAGWDEVGSALGAFGVESGAPWFGFVAALAECLGGVLVAAGLCFRPAALSIAVVMTVASAYHLTGEGSPAHALKNAFLFYGFVLTGPGRYSLDRAIRDWARPKAAPAASGVALLAIAAAPPAAAGQEALTSRIDAVRTASAAGEHELALARADSLVAWAPGHPYAVMTSAIAHAAAGRDGRAEADLSILLRWDPRYARDALEVPELSRLRARYPHVDSLAERADRPVSRGSVWAVLSERDLVLEGTAWDPATRSLLVGSLNKNTVVAVSPDGSVRDRVARGAHGLGSVVGIHVDSISRLLWVSSTPRYDDESDTTAAALYAFDAATGEFRRRVETGLRPSFPNDLTTGPDGTVYLTDSRAERVLVLRPGASDFEVLPTSRPFVSPNGITISNDGRLLFVSDLDHIRVVALAEGSDWRLAVPDSLEVSGIDGLAYKDGSLIAHHPLEYWRIARYALDESHKRVVGVEFIEWNSPDSRTSTTGEVVGDHYYYIGNGQLDRMNQGTIDAATMEPIRLYRIRLTPGTVGGVTFESIGVATGRLNDGPESFPESAVFSRSSVTRAPSSAQAVFLLESGYPVARGMSEDELEVALSGCRARS